MIETMAIGFAASLALSACVWAASVPLRDASIVDIAWGWLVMTPVFVAAALLPPAGPRTLAVLALGTLWALRLSAYIAGRHQGEDRRYRAIRERNQPNFAIKSLLYVFGLQAALGTVVALPAIGAIESAAPWNALDAAGIALAVAGLAIEAVADAQLARFKASPEHAGRVMDHGLWRFSRHPNYFGEFCMWWGMWLIAAAAGAWWWTIASPLLMSLLLLKVSGVTLLEQDLRERRPAYLDYIRRTNAFFPGSPRA